jgi:hypothetical protein
MTNLSKASNAYYNFKYRDDHPTSWWYIDDATGLLGGLKPSTTVGPTGAYPIASGVLTIPAQVDSVVVKSIASSLFTGYSTGDKAITSVVFESGSQLTTIGSYAFSFAGTITSISFPASLTTIGNYAFERLGNLSSITFHASGQLSTIGTGAFQFATSLTSLSLPKSLTSIGELAFHRASALPSVTFPLDSQLTTIGQQAFSECTSLTSLTLPASVTTIRSNIIASTTTQLKTVRFLGSAITSFNANAFTGAAGLRHVYVQEYNTDTLAGSPWGAVGAAIHWKDGNTGVDIRQSADGIWDYTSAGEIIDYSGPVDPDTFDLTIPATLVDASSVSTSITTMATGLFANIAGFKSVTISEGITSTSADLFANTPIQTLNLPASLITIGSSFAKCGLTQVNFAPDSLLTTIGGNSFTDNNLEAITLPDSLITIGANAFARNKLTTVVIPNNVTSLPQGAFANNRLTSVTLSQSLQTIGTLVFSNNRLTTIVFPESLKSIDQLAFEYNYLAGHIIIPKNVTSIGSNSFRGNNGITSFHVDQIKTEAPSAMKADSPWGAVNAANNITWRAISDGSSATFTQLPDTAPIAGGKGITGTIFYTINVPLGTFVLSIKKPDNTVVTSEDIGTTNYHQLQYNVSKNGTYTFVATILENGEEVEITLPVLINGYGPTRIDPDKPEGGFGEMRIDADAEVTLTNSTTMQTFISSATEQQIIDILYDGNPAIGIDLDSGKTSVAGSSYDPIHPVALSLASGDVTAFQGLDNNDEFADLTLTATFEAANGDTYTTSKTVRVILSTNIKRIFHVRAADLTYGTTGVGKFSDATDQTVEENTVTKTYTSGTETISASDIPTPEIAYPAGYAIGEVDFVGWYRGGSLITSEIHGLVSGGAGVQIAGTAVGLESATYEARFRPDFNKDNIDDRDQGIVTFDLDPGKTDDAIRGTFTYGGASHDVPYTITGTANDPLPAVSAAAKTADHEFAGWKLHGGDGTLLGINGFAENELTFAGDTVKEPVVYDGVFNTRVQFVVATGDSA